MKSMFGLAVIFFFGVAHGQSQNTVIAWSSFAGSSGHSTFTNTATWSFLGDFSGGPVQGGNVRVGAGFLAGISSQSVLTSVDEPVGLPTAFQLHQNYPNPFNPSTTIAYALASKSAVTIQIFNILGQLVTTLVQTEQPAGNYSLVWRGSSDGGVQVSSGIYFYRIHAKSNGNPVSEFSQTRKLMLVK